MCSIREKCCSDLRRTIHRALIDVTAPPTIWTDYGQYGAAASMKSIAMHARAVLVTLLVAFWCGTRGVTATKIGLASAIAYDNSGNSSTIGDTLQVQFTQDTSRPSLTNIDTWLSISGITLNATTVNLTSSKWFNPRTLLITFQSEVSFLIATLALPNVTALGDVDTLALTTVTSPLSMGNVDVCWSIVHAQGFLRRLCAWLPCQILPRP